MAEVNYSLSPEIEAKAVLQMVRRGVLSLDEARLLIAVSERDVEVLEKVLPRFELRCTLEYRKKVADELEKLVARLAGNVRFCPQGPGREPRVKRERKTPARGARIRIVRRSNVVVGRG